MAQVKLDIFRFDEATDTIPHRDVVTVDVPETTTVLDALENAKAEVDGSISFRRSCRSAICGSCSMNINGITGLACKTPCNTVMNDEGVIQIDPMPNFQPMKDLVVHMDPFWDKYTRLKPYLQPADDDADHERERRVSPDDMKKLVQAANCVMCATCYALCPVVSVDPAFSGPAAIAYAYRFIEDVRDGQRKERLAQINEDYLWLCAHCYACSYCPKHVDPHDRIVDVKRATVNDRVMMNERGPRHALVVSKTIKQTGMLAETEVIQGTIGRFNVRGLLKVAPLGLRMAARGKMPPPFLKPIPKVNEVRTIFEALEVPVS
ncbi:MAG: succinate dehydrogenase iron-sulfur subunit [Candidatus Eremiobacteraeota bacterium]|nr:succinate dehydrogenase iron-sulfur subunit [Candidatus Eremiobacteraeota bacterium]MBV8375265.1 succinate dehydrogenase iron-sulfur subunit [Candidatus Eremiobacteraeota bacterium]